MAWSIEKACAAYAGKRVLVFWSGGADSTALVMALAEAGAYVTILEVLTKQTPNPDAELHHRKQVLEWFAKNNVKYQKHYQFEMGVIYGNHGASYTQSWWWMQIAQLYRSSDYDCIAFGWVSGDDSVAWIAEYQQLWQAGECFLKEESPELAFPLAKIDKQQITNFFDQHVSRPPVWWCELPVDGVTSDNPYTECGKCPSCLDAFVKGMFRVFKRKHPYFED